MDVTLSSGQFVDEFATGNFTSAATARSCGSTVFLPGGFLFGFPHDIEHHDVEDVTFSADALQPGGSTSAFMISVNIDSPAIGHHPLTFLDTTDADSGAAGSAQVSVANGTRTLKVDAADKDGVSIHLIAVCSPV